MPMDEIFRCELVKIFIYSIVARIISKKYFGLYKVG